MDANYLYIPLSVDGVNGLESVLVHKDTSKQVIFKGCRVIESPLIPSSDSVELPPIEEGVVIQLMSKLKPMRGLHCGRRARSIRASSTLQTCHI